MNNHPARLIGAALIATVAGLSAPAAAETRTEGAARIWNAPPGFIPPPLNPAGVTLRTRALAPGVYALVSGQPAVDNSGFVVGEDGVLVIDAHINGTMARQIQAAVREVTDKPILYLVNTNFHGDHTFGNYAFPAATRIIAHRATALRMRDFEHEKRLLLTAVDNDPTVFADVRLRLPDLVFDDYLRIDLGGRVVELHHFGPGNTPGDTVVYVAAAKVAWTGNLVVGAGTIPPLFEGGVARYLETIARFAGSLQTDIIIPGHGAPATGAILGRYLAYLNELLRSVRAAAGDGKTLEETLASLPLGASYLPPAGSPAAALTPFLNGLHRLNVQQTYLELNGG
ncbi:MAG: MBL fold metallo-hydrolase [Alphaproteobacteria bacterium]